MRHHLLLALLVTGCATPADSSGPALGGIPNPMDQGGKGDGEVQCGTGACSNDLCAWDCSQSGQTCAEACTTDNKADVFVTATSGSDVMDSRATPYKPRFALDNVLIYGCELWNFSGSGKQGLEIELTELIHSSFTVDPNDPTRNQRKLDVYVGNLEGPGDYHGEGLFAHSSESTTYTTSDGCAVHVTADRGGLAGTFSCSLAATGGETTTMSGQFSCPGNGLASQDFVAWTPAP